MQRPFAHLLGVPMLCLAGGQDLAFAAERRNQMLAYLGCCCRWATRDELATLLWTQRDQAAARSNLRNLVLQVRRLAIAGFETRGETLRWAIASDVQAFEAAVSGRDWTAALAAYGGPLLVGFDAGAPPPFAAWLRFERARLEALWRDALTVRLDELTADPPARAALARQVLQADPLNEAALSAFMHAQAALHAPAEAQRVWRTYVALLAEEHGIEPSTELRALAAQTHATPPRPEAVGAAPAGCIGRRIELMQIRQLLADADCRLLTLTGTGGIGKSTLARAALPLLSSQFTDIVPWIALEDLTQVDDVAPRIAARIDLQLSGTDPPLAQVMRSLRTRPRVLVFDNAEHLTGFDRLAETLLRECAQLKLVVTSRGRIGVLGEWLLPLEGLPMPDRDEHDAEVLRAFDAVRLFEQRAKAAGAAFDLAAQAADVVALTHAVEGLPLALELAAPWTRLLPVREIVRELQRSLDLLAAPASAEAPDRSLRASFEHSWRLLSPREREVLPRLAVFAGSFSRAGADEVAHAPLPVLAALVDKSLLRAEGDGRFSLHPLLRQCAAERAHDYDETGRRHADFYSRLYARHTNFGRTDQKRALDELELELSNARAAWAFAVGKRVSATLGRMAMPLKHYYWERGRPDDGIELLSSVTQLLSENVDHEREPLAKCLLALAGLERSKCNFEAVQALAGRALRLFESLDQGGASRICLNLMGVSFWQRSRNDEATRCFERILSSARADEDAEHIAVATGSLALVHYSEGRYEQALPLFQQALEIDRRNGNVRGEVVGLNNLGLLHLQRGDCALALQSLQEALRLSDRHGLTGIRVYSLLNVGLALLKAGELSRSAAHCREALREARVHQLLQIELEATLALARLASKHAVPEDPHELVLWALRSATGYPGIQLHGVVVLAQLVAAAGDVDRAAAYFAYAAHDPRLDHNKRVEALEAIERLGMSHAQREAAKKAATTLTLDAILREVPADPTTHSAPPARGSNAD